MLSPEYTRSCEGGPDSVAKGSKTTRNRKNINPHLEHMQEDILYHLALGTKSHDLELMFGDVKFICMGGATPRMEYFANYIMDFIGHKLPIGTTLRDITELSHRFSMYKVGPVISVSHGMGLSSIGILLHELMKLAHYAKMKDPIFFRIGTCGGIGVDPGTVVVSNDAIDGLGQHCYEIPMLGKNVKRPSIFDQDLVKELLECADVDDSHKTVVGGTMAASDFYEGQGRLDGMFCDYTEADKMKYLNDLYNQGVRNIEMEATALSAMTHHAGFKAACVNVTLLNRLNGDQITPTKKQILEWQDRPQKLVSTYIKRYLDNKLENGN